MKPDDILRVDQLFMYVKEIFKTASKKVNLQNIRIISYTKSRKSLYFNVISPENSKCQIILWCHSTLLETFQNTTLFEYIDARANVQGILSVNKYNKLVIDVTKFDLIQSHPNLPLFCNRIAVISNANKNTKYDTGFGLQDFLCSLKYGQVTIFDVKISHPDDIARCIRKINIGKDYDCICIIRGGGSDKEMAIYNENDDLALSIKKSKIPIILGIGHKNNTFSFDKYATQVCINPTAAAYFINERFKQLQTDIEKKMLLCESIAEAKR